MLEDLSADGVCAAFSGGVDSSLLLTVLSEISARKQFPLLAVVFATAFHTAEETASAMKQAEELGVPAELVERDVLSDPAPAATSLCRILLQSRFSAHASTSFTSSIGTTTAGISAEKSLALSAPNVSPKSAFSPTAKWRDITSVFSAFCELNSRLSPISPATSPSEVIPSRGKAKEPVKPFLLSAKSFSL